MDKTKVYQVDAEDLNNMQCDDLVVSDENGNLRIYYNNNCDGFSGDADFIKSFGVEISNDVDVSGEVYIANEFVEEGDFSLQLNGENFNFASFENAGLDIEKNYLDVNGDTLKVGDIVKVQIRLENLSANNLNLLISDSTPLAMSINSESLACLTVGCDELEFLETGVSLRSHVIDGLSLEPNETVNIEYEMKVDVLPTLEFVLGDDLAQYPVNVGDNFTDIYIKNQSGDNLHLYSRGLRADNTVFYGEMVEEIVMEEEAEDVIFDSDGNAPTSAAQNALNNAIRERNADKDLNGCSDFWSGYVPEGENPESVLAQEIKGGISKLRCDGAGCAPTPYNKAFFVPDQAQPGTAILSILNTPPFVNAPGISNTPNSVFRLYLSPTLSLGLGTAICVGPGNPTHTTSACFAFAAPGGIPGVCEQVEEEIGDFKEAITAGDKTRVSDSGLASVISDGEGLGNANDIKLGGNFGGGNDFISGAAKANIKVPGFPSVITNWVDAQTDEIYSKLLDFPKIYLILPDLVAYVEDNAYAASNVNIQSFNDFARSINSIPLVNIESREVVVRIPSISAEEIEKYRNQWTYFTEDMNRQLEDRLLNWDCNENLERQSICDKLTADVNVMINGVNELLNFLDRLSQIPQEILNYRYLEAKYATQIICYLDADEFCWWDIKRQERIIKSWIQSAEDAVREPREWL